jgi:O-succinylbenzoate synthase
MALKAHFYKHTLNFNFDAGTSRGVLKKKDSYFIKLTDADICGYGEAGPLSGLSPDFGEKAESKLKEICEQINRGKFNLKTAQLSEFPSVLFALETAFRDLENGGKREIFSNSFYSNEQRIPINGLIWMGKPDFMKEQIIEKINAGYTTIKLKIGAIDFNEELSLLKFIRTEFKNDNLTLRVDANGAFSPEKAFEKLNRLSEYNLHSIEQPIAVNQEEVLAKLCEVTPVPIVLDEELIGNSLRKRELLNSVKPQYIILKPSLMGGISGSNEWIQEAENINIKWWITSALESNIGLNAICQFTAEFDNSLPQGLGTGKLYTNNFDSPLEISNGEIFYNQEKEWKLSMVNY